MKSAAKQMIAFSCFPRFQYTHQVERIDGHGDDQFELCRQNDQLSTMSPRKDTPWRTT
jgi:hypothetical protein